VSPVQDEVDAIVWLAKSIEALIATFAAIGIQVEQAQESIEQVAMRAADVRHVLQLGIMSIGCHLLQDGS